MAQRYGYDVNPFGYFDTPNEFRPASSFRAMNTPNVYTSGILTPSVKQYLEEEGGEIEKEDFERFEPKGILSKALDFGRRPDVRTGLGLLFGGIPGALLSFFAPKIGEGITSLVNRFKPAPEVPIFSGLGDTDMTRDVTTSSGQTVRPGDLVSITDETGAPTGISEYSSPGVAAQYEGSF
jgi:hypothetical protein